MPTLKAAPLPPNDLPANPYVQPLGRLADVWLDPSSPLRLKSVEALMVSTGYSEKIIHRAIDNVFEEITKYRIQDFIKTLKVDEKYTKTTVVLHIGAGNVFTSWLHGVVISILLGYRCWIKPSSKEPIFANLLFESIKLISKELSDRMEIVKWNAELMMKSDIVIAYGTDETINELRQLANPSKLFIGYGNKMSVGLVFNEATDADSYRIWMERAQSDIEMFDMNGCLSPQVMFIEGQDAGLWKSIELSNKKHPSIHLFKNLSDVVAILKAYEGHLSAMGIAGDISNIEPIRHDLEQLGITRICKLGYMQRPPLDWRNGGISLVDVLNTYKGV